MTNAQGIPTCQPLRKIQNVVVQLALTDGLQTSEKSQKLKRPLLRFPKGYTTKALRNKPTVIPIAT